VQKKKKRKRGEEKWRRRQETDNLIRGLEGCLREKERREERDCCSERGGDFYVREKGEKDCFWDVKQCHDAEEDKGIKKKRGRSGSGGGARFLVEPTSLAGRSPKKEGGTVEGKKKKRKPGDGGKFSDKTKTRGENSSETEGKKSEPWSVNKESRGCLRKSRLLETQKKGKSNPPGKKKERGLFVGRPRLSPHFHDELLRNGKRGQGERERK